MKFEAILFDCDGVLVDSEPITNGVLRDMLAEAGWALSTEECMRLFIGKTVRSEAARIEAIKLWAKGRGMSEAYSEKLMTANPDCVSLLHSYSRNARAIETDHLAKAAKKLTDAGVRFPDDSYGQALANPPSKGKAAEMAAQRRILETGVCKRN